MDDLIQEDDAVTDNYLEYLVGDDKKFKTPEDLAKGKYESDLYIKTLTAKMDEMRNDYTNLRNDYNSRAKLEELIDQVKAGNQKANAPDADDTKKPEINPDDLIRLVNEQFQKNKVQELEETNYKQVQQRLKERFGSNREAFKQHLDALDLSEEVVKQLARKNPKLVLKTLDLDNRGSGFDAPMRSNQRTDLFAPKAQKRDWDYWQKVKKDNPDYYWSAAGTNQMHEDYRSLGSDFETESFTEDFSARTYNGPPGPVRRK